MMKNSKQVTSGQPYVDSLPPVVNARYHEKFCAIGGFDPYEIVAKEWSRGDTHLPPVGYEDIVDYLMVRKSAYTKEKLKAVKSLGAHNQVTSGWVHEVFTFVHPGPKTSNTAGNVVISAKVNHSQRLTGKPLQPWVIVDSSGTILSAHCTCMAVLGESCSHVAALLFTVDTMVKVRDSTTVTQKPAYWKQPGFKEVAYARAHEMDFTSSQMKKKRLDHDSVAHSVKSKPGSGRSSAKDIPPLTAAEVARIHQRIYFPNSGVKPALLSLVAGFEGDYITHSTSTLPAILVDVKKGDIDKHLTVTHEQVALAEEKTRGQAQCKLWHRLRIGRITASNLHAVTRTDPANPSNSVLRQICNPVGVNSPALEWGRQNEAKALEKYKRIFSEIHSNFQEKRCGLYISTECSFVGASPDGMRQCDCCGTGCVEVKYPYATRNLTIDEAIDNRKDFCLFKSADGCFVLKKNHPYYLQVQCQIFVTKSEFCDFVVCTESDLVAVKVLPDRDAWEEALEKAKVFFNMCILPILVSSDDSESEQSGESVASESDGKSVVHESAGKSVVHESAGGSAVHESGEESAVHEPHSVVLSPKQEKIQTQF